MRFEFGYIAIRRSSGILPVLMKKIRLLHTRHWQSAVQQCYMPIWERIAYLKGIRIMYV